MGAPDAKANRADGMKETIATTRFRTTGGVAVTRTSVKIDGEVNLTPDVDPISSRAIPLN